ncbi:MAG: AAA family ATPase [bacterium]
MIGTPSFTQIYSGMLAELQKAIQGLDATLETVLVGFLSGGHLLFEGVPGVGKTLMANALARSFQGSFSRIQFTPDLMPSDILGTSVYRMSPGGGKEWDFQFKPGPIFANVVLADEINRAAPKTQSALLQAMQEETVTADGVNHPLPHPFFVIATMNPIELQGTFPLPEAQLDRFLMKIVVPYPDSSSERDLLRNHPGVGHLDALLEGIQPVVIPEALNDLRQAYRSVVVKDEVLDYVHKILLETRKSRWLMLGASPRAGIHLFSAAKVYALTQGRDFVTPDDIKALILPILRHRIVLRPEAQIEGITPDGILTELLNSIPVPR